MSLTDFIKREEIRTRLDQEIPNAGSRASEPVKAEWQTQNYRLVGTAFDYLFRWWVRREVDEFYARPWIAETSLELAEEVCPGLEPDIEITIDEAKQLRGEFVESGAVTRPLVESAIDLARIDGIYRGGVPPTNLGKYDGGDIDDCIRLIEVLSESNAIGGREAHLNPTFGLASSLVGGADADMILDGTLVDVKVTGSASFKAGYWRQLVGYLILADIHRRLVDTGAYDQLGLGAKFRDQPVHRIDELGVYFGRHGELSTVPASTVYESNRFGQIRTWFAEVAIENPSELDSETAEFLKVFL